MAMNYSDGKFMCLREAEFIQHRLAHMCGNRRRNLTRGEKMLEARNMVRMYQGRYNTAVELYTMTDGLRKVAQGERLKRLEKSADIKFIEMLDAESALTDASEKLKRLLTSRRRITRRAKLNE
jgi:hypothetical protein